MKDCDYEFADTQYYVPTEFEKLGGLWPLRSGQNTAKANYAVGPRVIARFACIGLPFPGIRPLQ